MGCPLLPLKDRRGIIIIHAFQKIVSKGGKAESEGQCKPNKLWVDQGDEFCNNLSKGFLKINNIEMYSTCNEGKSVVAERFIRTLKNMIFTHMTAVPKNVCFDVSDNIVNTYNKTVHRTIKMKPIDVASNFCSECNEDSNRNRPKFKVGDRVNISKNKNIFAKGYSQNLSE